MRARQLPAPLRYWQHRHLLQPAPDGGTYIVEDLEYRTGYAAAGPAAVAGRVGAVCLAATHLPALVRGAGRAIRAGAAAAGSANGRVAVYAPGNPRILPPI